MGGIKEVKRSAFSDTQWEAIAYRLLLSILAFNKTTLLTMYCTLDFRGRGVEVKNKELISQVGGEERTKVEM